MPCSDVIVIVMAAGQSRRFGSDKRAAKLSSGETLLSTTLLTIQKYFLHSRVVIKPEDNAQSLGLSLMTPTIISPRSHLGLGFSISDAFTHLIQDKDMHHYRAAAIWLGDLPWVSLQTCSLLTKLVTPESIVQPLYQRKPGHPVIFGRKFWCELAHLENEKGANSVIKKHSNRIINVTISDPGVCSDVDYPDDLIKLPNNKKTHKRHITTQ
ncbi:MAG: nucleotidyltransferase family protein [Halomonas sp.]|nr:nucleotidyltransferase family protein [Halomonas sp.]MCC5901476.1 nucleotidyltransferase family protein [Halomonas sp.]